MTTQTKRPILREVPLSDVLPIRRDAAQTIVTMSEGQWDDLLDYNYNHGSVLLELDAHERPVKAYQRPRP